MSPSFASLYAGLLKQELIFNHQTNPINQHILKWKRYLDDVFFTWTGPQTMLKELEKQTHAVQYVIANKMNFLNILVIKEKKQP